MVGRVQQQACGAWGSSRRPTVDSKSEEEVSEDEGQVQEFCARKARGDDKADSRTGMDSLFQTRSLRLLFSHRVVAGSLRPRELQYARLPCQSRPEEMYHRSVFAQEGPGQDDGQRKKEVSEHKGERGYKSAFPVLFPPCRCPPLFLSQHRCLWLPVPFLFLRGRVSL